MQMSIQQRLGRWNSIRNRIFVSILLFLIFPLMLTNYLMDKPLERVMVQKISGSAQDALHMSTFNVQLFLEDMLRSSVNITVNPSVVTLLKNPAAYSGFEKLRLNDAVLNRLFSRYFTHTYITMFDRHGSWVSSRYLNEQLYHEYVDSGWYASMMSKPYQLQWMFNDKQLLYTDREPLITLVKTITEQQTVENIGMIAFSVAEEDIRKYLSGLEGEVYLVDQQGTIVSSTLAERVGQSVAEESYMPMLRQETKGQNVIRKDRQQWIVNFDTVAINGWKLVQLVPYDTVFKEINDIRTTNDGIILLIFIVFTIITLSISYGITRPLKLLKKRMQEIEEKDFHSVLQITGPEEVSSLIVTYNKMVAEIRQLLRRLKEQYEQKEDMRFRALQAQINPHFILNTLNNIKWMAYIRSDAEVGDMLSNLGGILESSIGRGASLIPLRQEIQYIENYVGLMNMKFHDKLKVEYDIPEDLMEQEVVKIMLQPIIENSLLHGIEPLAGNGRITVRATLDGERFVLTVADNGVGISGEKLKAIRGRLAAGTAEPLPERIGMQNVHDRIRLQYGDEYGIRISSEPDEGTTVDISLPAKKAAGGECQ